MPGSLASNRRLARLAQNEELGFTGRKTRSRRGLGKGVLAMSASLPLLRIDLSVLGRRRFDQVYTKDITTRPNPDAGDLMPGVLRECRSAPLP